MQTLLIAIQFLTRLPLNINIDWKEEKIAGSLVWYPLVGGLIGLFLIILAISLPTQETMLNAALVLCAWVLISGGLHLDGLADSADAWVGSHGDKQRALDIMKDPQAGPVAVIVLVLLLLIKFAALQSLLSQGEISLLLLAPVLGRSAPLILFLTTPYVREQGLGSSMAEHLPRQLVWGVLLLTATGVMIVTGLLKGLLLLGIVLLVIWLLRLLMLKHLHGMTGDTLGATIEIIEAVVLCVLVFSLNSSVFSQGPLIHQ